MKFWQKIFVGTLIIFIVVFDAGAFYLTSYAYNFNRQREAESGIREQGIILSSVASRIANAEGIYPNASHDKERLVAVLRPLSDYYKPQGVFFALYDGDNEIYADMTDIDKELTNLENVQRKNVTDGMIDHKRYVFVSSLLPETSHLTFIYARDISRIDDFRTDVSRIFIIMNIVVLFLLSGSIYLLLKHMTKPITKLKEITSEIADGAYEKRVSINRKDELGSLADSFNRMADSVEDHMAKLTKAAEDKQQFIDDLAHEIKTPLTSILGYSEYLQNAKSTEEERITAAGHLHHMAHRLKSLSEKLLELTFLREEKIKMQAVDITAMFKDLNDMMYPILTSRNLKLTTAATFTQINGDETLLLSLLTNLVENAARASQGGATVTVKAYDDNGPVIEVTDTGHGMKQEEIEKITAPFYRVDKSRSREFGGVGLGLSIVSQIASLHGAKLDVESILGEGTTIRVYFIL